MAERTYLSICAIYRNEARYLREWIAFHRLVGVDRFFLYDNTSTDADREALAPFVESGVAVVHDWPHSPGQLVAYEHCLRNYRSESRWIAFIDVDEFLFSPTYREVPDLLRDYEEFPGVVVNWAMFGTSGHRAPPAGLVVENYLRRTDNEIFNRHIKTVVDPSRVAHFCTPHFFTYRGGPGVDENRQAVPPRNYTDGVSFARLRVNHYVTRSEDEFRRKLATETADFGRLRPDSEGRTARFLARLDEVRDQTMLRYVEPVRASLARLDADGLSA
jgi:hypothetical protein